MGIIAKDILEIYDVINIDELHHIKLEDIFKMVSENKKILEKDVYKSFDFFNFPNFSNFSNFEEDNFIYEDDLFYEDFSLKNIKKNKRYFN